MEELLNKAIRLAKEYHKGQMDKGGELTENLKDEIKRAIREGISPRHVPAKILQVPDIPRTKSGKIVELAVRTGDVYQRRRPGGNIVRRWVAEVGTAP